MCMMFASFNYYFVVITHFDTARTKVLKHKQEFVCKNFIVDTRYVLLIIMYFLFSVSFKIRHSLHVCFLSMHSHQQTEP